MCFDWRIGQKLWTNCEKNVENMWGENVEKMQNKYEGRGKRELELTTPLFAADMIPIE